MKKFLRLMVITIAVPMICKASTVFAYVDNSEKLTVDKTIRYFVEDTQTSSGALDTDNSGNNDDDDDLEGGLTEVGSTQTGESGSSYHDIIDMGQPIVRATHTVTFVTNGGSKVEAQSVRDGGKIRSVTTPQKRGYKFVGWYTNNTLTQKFNSSSIIKAPLTLYAKYEKCDYKIWFNANGGTAVNSITVKGDTPLTSLPVTKKSGYRFAGWYYNGKAIKAGDKVYSNMTLAAKWESTKSKPNESVKVEPQPKPEVVNKYTVTFASNGGSNVAPQYIKSGDKLSFLATPKKDGYRFLGWYTDSSLTQKFNSATAVKASFTLYAKYEKIECRIWFNADGGDPVNSIAVMADTPIEALPDTKKTGYRFAGWFNKAGNPVKAGDRVYNNEELKAKWELVIAEKAPEDASGFIDVDANDAYYEAINWIYKEKIMVGYNNSVFAPEAEIKGSNVVTVLSKLSAEDLTGYAAEGAWYSRYVSWAADKGIVGKDFNADSVVTREDMAVMLLNYMNYAKADYSKDIASVKLADSDMISDYAVEAVNTLVSNGILSADAENNIKPEDGITRAEFASLVKNIYDLNKAE